MKLSTKSRYGVRAMFDMAYHAGNLPAQIKDISRRQNISPRYLEQIFQDLKKAGLLKSRRGPQGGYSLARSADKITVKKLSWLRRANSCWSTALRAYARTANRPRSANLTISA